jgi:hypothetical protein
MASIRKNGNPVEGGLISPVIRINNIQRARYILSLFIKKEPQSEPDFIIKEILLYL